MPKTRFFFIFLGLELHRDRGKHAIHAGIYTKKQIANGQGTDASRAQRKGETTWWAEARDEKTTEELIERICELFRVNYVYIQDTPNEIKVNPRDEQGNEEKIMDPERMTDENTIFTTNIERNVRVTET